MHFNNLRNQQLQTQVDNKAERLTRLDEKCLSFEDTSNWFVLFLDLTLERLKFLP